MSAKTDFAKLGKLVTESKTVHQSYRYQNASKHSRDIYDQAIAMGQSVLNDQSDPKMYPEIMAGLAIQTINNAKRTLDGKVDHRPTITAQLDRLGQFIHSQEFAGLPFDDQQDWRQLIHRVDQLKAHADEHEEELTKLAQQIAHKFSEQSTQPQAEQAEPVTTKAIQTKQPTKHTTRATGTSSNSTHMAQATQPVRGMQQSQTTDAKFSQPSASQLTQPQVDDQPTSLDLADSATTSQSTPAQSENSQTVGQFEQPTTPLAKSSQMSSQDTAVSQTSPQETQPTVASQISLQKSQPTATSQTSSQKAQPTTVSQTTSRETQASTQSTPADLATAPIDSTSSSTAPTATQGSQTITKKQPTFTFDPTSQPTNPPVQESVASQEAPKQSVWHAIWQGLGQALGFSRH